MRELTARRAWRSLRRWWWMALVVPLLLGGGTYLAASRITPLYRADTTLVIAGSPGSGASSDYNDVLAAERRAETLSALATGRTVLTQVITDLGLATTPEDLAREVSVTPVSNTQLLRVAVADPDPGRAATIANAVAEVFTRIVRDRLGVTLQAFDTAVVPAHPVTPRVPLLTGLGGGLGLLAGLGLCLTLAYRDDTIETPEELRRATGAVLLGGVAVAPAPAEPVARDDAGAEEDFRLLRVNLQLAARERGVRTILFASDGPDAETAEIVARLGDACARAGVRVAVITGAVREPALTSSGAVRGEPASLADRVPPNSRRVVVRDPGGHGWADQDVARTAESIRQPAAEHDLVLVAGPPGAAGPALVLTGAIDGVVVVACAGSSRASSLARAIRELNRAGAPLLGAVLGRPARHRRAAAVGLGRAVPARAASAAADSPSGTGH